VCKTTDPSAEDSTQMEFKVALNRVEMRAESGWPPPALISNQYVYTSQRRNSTPHPRRLSATYIPAVKAIVIPERKFLPKRASVA